MNTAALIATAIANSRNVTRLPTEAAARKAVPIATGVVDYFPLALVAVAELSKKGNDQHNPGKPLHWDRSKSTDEADALMRHFIDRGTLDVDGVRHSAKVAWRALALLQKEIEAGAVTPQQKADVALAEYQAQRPTNAGGYGGELAAWRTETREDARRTATSAMQAREPAESRYGFTVGETVNQQWVRGGDRSCKVTGFTADGRIVVKWRSSMHDGFSGNSYLPEDLRHGP